MPVVGNTPGPGPRHGQGRHPRLPALASGRGEAGADRRVTTSSAATPATTCRSPASSCCAATTTAPTNTAAAWKTACACSARSSRRPRRRSATRMGVVVRFAVDETARRRRHGVGQGRPRDRRDAGRAARPVGRQRRRVGERFGQTSRFAEEGVPGALRRIRQAGDDQAGGRRRPLHQRRPHGERDQQAASWT